MPFYRSHLAMPLSLCAMGNRGDPAQCGVGREFHRGMCGVVGRDCDGSCRIADI